MIFNGHKPADIDEIDAETFSEICVMYGDGVLGGKSAWDAITPITTAIFNYLRDPTTPFFKSEQLFPWIKDYDINPDFQPDEEEVVSNQLLVFMSQSPGFNMERFKHGD
jgi:hypothetical protein